MWIPKGQGAARRDPVGTNTVTIPKAGTRSRGKAVVGGEWVEGACPEAEAGYGNENIQGDGLTVPPDRDWKREAKGGQPQKREKALRLESCGWCWASRSCQRCCLSGSAAVGGR